jgi:hypothetical protein
VILRQFFVCHAVNWEPLGQFTSNFAVIGIDSLTVCILFGEISIFHSSVMGLYSSNCRRFFVCRAVNWEPLGQFTSNFAQLLELIVLRSVYFLVKFQFFIQELWERKSLQILYECWRRAYHALLVQLFIIIFFGQLKDWVEQVLLLVSCPKGQVEKYVNVEACFHIFAG